MPQKQATILATLSCALLLGSSQAASAGILTVPPGLDLVEVTTGLDRPVAIAHAGDGSGRLFIVEQDGPIRIYDTATGTLLPTPFLDLTTVVDSSENEQGLLGLAFDPNYESNGYFFVNYTMDPGAGDDRTQVARYQVSAGDPNVANPATARIILEVEQDSWNHNGGDIHFSPVDGLLYIGMGDGGGSGDSPNNAQTMNRLLGKMLRIDPHEGPGGTPECGFGTQNYTIPADNPFVDGAGGDCDEIWQVGLRNPWRWSFDRITGDQFIGDVGQGLWEEVDFAPQSAGGGQNWGWRCYEGNNPYNTTGCGPMNDYDFPILEYSSGNTTNECSVVGGYRYRGPIADLYGSYLFADYCSGEIYYAEESAPMVWSSTQWTDESSISAFGEDEVGNLYVAFIFSGSIYRVDLDGILFSDGFETGDTTRW